jgi:hypothetical protein
MQLAFDWVERRACARKACCADDAAQAVRNCADLYAEGMNPLPDAIAESNCKALGRRPEVRSAIERRGCGTQRRIARVNQRKRQRAEMQLAWIGLKARWRAQSMLRG